MAVHAGSSSVSSTGSRWSPVSFCWPDVPPSKIEDFFCPVTQVSTPVLSVEPHPTTDRITELEGLVARIRKVQEFVKVISTDVVSTMAPEITNPKVEREFRADPKFDPVTFVEIFSRRSQVDPKMVIVGFYYMVRIQKRFPKLGISLLNATRLLFVASCIAAKFYDDRALRFKNHHWIVVGGNWLPLSKFNVMEREFLSLLNYDLSVDKEGFSVFCEKYGMSDLFGDLITTGKITGIPTEQ